MLLPAQPRFAEWIVTEFSAIEKSSNYIFDIIDTIGINSYQFFIGVLREVQHVIRFFAVRVSA